MARIDLKADAVLATPPVAVVTATLTGIPIQEWVYILTALYTLFLIGEKLFKWFKAWQERKIFRASLELPPERKE
jgi:hypothetical protein